MMEFSAEELVLARRLFKLQPDSPWTPFLELRDLFPDPSLERRQALFAFVASESAKDVGAAGKNS